MEEKLNKLYKECINELNSINIDFTNCNINISISKRNNKRYGCCKLENNKYSIEISRWVLELNDSIIKNTIIHELIHCIPNCNNHGKIFKYYAETINNKLGYNISRLGNKQEDYMKSNLEYTENTTYRYKFICSNCNTVYFRQRICKNFEKKYRCGKCKGKLISVNS